VALEAAKRARKMALFDTKLVPLSPVVHQMYLVHKISLIARACIIIFEKDKKMTSTMTPSQRRRAYKLKRIVITEHSYFALKRLRQAGDSFNDVISNLLRIEKNHPQEKVKKALQHQQQPTSASGTTTKEQIWRY
jgi:predicted CopG family antitoxin